MIACLGSTLAIFIIDSDRPNHLAKHTTADMLFRKARLFIRDVAFPLTRKRESRYLIDS